MKAWSVAWNSAGVSVLTSAAQVIQLRRTEKGCLSYLIGADGEAAVIDASLDPELYSPTPPNHDRIVDLNEAGIIPVGDVIDLEAGANRCAVR